MASNGGQDLFELALLVADMEAIAGVKLYRSGNRLRGSCPLCKASPKRKDGGAFSVDPVKKTWKCWGCDVRGGDAVDLEHRLHSRLDQTLRDAAIRIVGEDPASIDVKKARAEREALARQADADNERTRLWKAAMALSLWRDALPAAGTPVETYLRGRGISGRPLAEALKQVRYHPAAYHSGPIADPVTAPAMIGLLMTPFGPTGGVHATYLSADGKTKTHLDPQRRKWGPPGRMDDHGVVHPGGVWLTPPTSEGPLVCGEGIETTLSAACEIGIPVRAVAALDLDALQGGLQPDSRGRHDLRNLQRNALLPAFTWPEPAAAPWGSPMICLDRDMTPIKIRTNGPDDEAVEEVLDADMRAMLCAVLASAAWTEAGARWVTPIAPCNAGWDFNDQRHARLAGLLGDRPGVIEVGLLPDFHAAAAAIGG